MNDGWPFRTDQIVAPEPYLRDVRHGTGVIISPFTNLYECGLGDDVFVGPFVEIQRGVTVGARTRIQSHTFVCEHVTIGADCFIGHGVMFTNDRHPHIGGERGTEETIIEDGVTIGSGATLLPVRVGAGAVIGAGATVTHDVEPGDTIISPAGMSMSDVRKLTSEGEQWRQSFS